MIEPQLPGFSEPPDPAAQAFETLREEVALLRRAVAGLAAERSSLEIPDYSETLARIATTVSSISKRLVALAETPAFGLSPQELSRHIAAASEKVRREDRETIAQSSQALRQATKDLTASLMSAREVARQQKLLLWTGGGSVIAGMLIGVLLIAPIMRHFF
jgi:hypothetical protein